MNLEKNKENNTINRLYVNDNKKTSPKISMTYRAFDYWLKKNTYYHRQIINFYKFVVPENMRVLHINCANGYILDALKTSQAVGIEADELCLLQAQELYPSYAFYESLSHVQAQESFDYIILSLATMQTYDIQNFFITLQPFCKAHTRIIIDHYSYLWEPILYITEKLGLRRPTQLQNWISVSDLENFLQLSGYEVINQGKYMLMPINIPLFSFVCNSILAPLPIINRLCLQQWIVAKPIFTQINPEKLKVSVVVPCKNEKGNIEQAVLKIPQMSQETEIIFVEGNSQDQTLQEIQRVSKAYPSQVIRWFVQDGKGKGDAVRKGFAQATGHVLMILDADLTVPPQELTKFFDALVQGKGEFINGSRLVYGMENGSMRFLNLLANYFFSVLFSWTLNQKVKDTLCGTKVLWASDYQKIVQNRHFFGNFDPFGDFDLLFGAAKLNLKIVDMPIHYKNRVYGSTQIRRFYHGWILLGMSLLALKKFKFRQ